ncbi:hypothetical protein AFLA_009246 [Aspergillus flavus NRRL3357]|nr:hypothetical protein AFLA_009246 [Aspergillus flavus NRRL3357]
MSCFQGLRCVCVACAAQSNCHQLHLLAHGGAHPLRTQGDFLYKASLIDGHTTFNSHSISIAADAQYSIHKSELTSFKPTQRYNRMKGRLSHEESNNTIFTTHHKTQTMRS